MSSNQPPLSGTGDGRAPLRSRKITSFILLVLSIIALLWVTTRIGTPENVVTQALWVIGVGGYFTIGGQTLVDALLKSRWGAVAGGESKSVVEKSTVISSGPGTP